MAVDEDGHFSAVERGSEGRTFHAVPQEVRVVRLVFLFDDDGDRYEEDLVVVVFHAQREELSMVHRLQQARVHAGGLLNFSEPREKVGATMRVRSQTIARVVLKGVHGSITIYTQCPSQARVCYFAYGRVGVLCHMISPEPASSWAQPFIHSHSEGNALHKKATNGG